MSETCSNQGTECGRDHVEQGKTDFREAPHDLSHIKKVIGVVSGKGGVGKTLVTSLLAVIMRRHGYASAISGR